MTRLDFSNHHHFFNNKGMKHGEIIRTWNRLVIEGNANSGHRGHAGRLGEVGGSLPGVASPASMEAFRVGDSFPDANQSKSWAKKLKTEYDRNEDFRSAVKTATAFAGGQFKEVIAVDRFLSSGETPEFGDINFSLVPKDKRPSDMKGGKVIELDKASVGDICFGLFDYGNNPFESSKEASNKSMLEGKERVIDGVRELNRVLRDSEPMKVPIYRGIAVNGNLGRSIEWERKSLRDYERDLKGAKSKADIKYYGENITRIKDRIHILEKQKKAADVILNLKKGEPFYLKSFTSFSADEYVAKQFSEGKNPGQGGRGLQKSVSSIVFETAPGAKGVSISRFSKWKQKEVITKGDFIIDNVERRQKWDGGETIRIRLKAKT